MDRDHVIAAQIDIPAASMTLLDVMAAHVAGGLATTQDGAFALPPHALATHSYAIAAELLIARADLIRRVRHKAHGVPVGPVEAEVDEV